MKDTVAPASKRKVLTRALDAYLDFSKFVAGKLRILSKDTGWLRYRDSPATWPSRAPMRSSCGWRTCRTTSASGAETARVQSLRTIGW